MTAVNPLVQGDRARLNSERLTPTAGFACLHFWYNMYGQDMGSLRVRINHGIPGTHDIDEDAKEFTVWELDGDQGKEWQEANVSI